MIMDTIQKDLLEKVAGLHEIPSGAYNIRLNGTTSHRNVTDEINIITKEDKSGIDIYIKPNTKNKSLHIPVILSKAGLKEMVYNDFHIGENADVTIIAGCGIHTSDSSKSQHDGIHSFFLKNGAKVRYVEKHYGAGDGNGKRIMNPTTIVELGEDSYMEMETTQIKGVDSTDRITKAKLDKNSTLVVKEKLMTHGNQYAKTYFEIDLDGENSSTNVISRSVAKGNSKQEFLSKVNGNSKCMGHTECDAIIMDNAKVSALPEVVANDLDAQLIHEAAIGKIAGEQIIKLMTLGLSEEEAEAQIVNGFLR
jgi:Fe-S cluster assembly scaffold protein SufB